MNKKNILVFPCGSEVALEIYRSLEHSIHFNLIGGNSTDDHGKFVFQNYIGNIPFVNHENFIPILKDIVTINNIDAIFPAMDSVITKLKSNESFLGCKVISSEVGATKVCLSKLRTYQELKEVVAVPKVYNSIDEVMEFPVFLKPDIGYGSRGALKANSRDEIKIHMFKYPNSIILEYLPGDEFTVDCFTNFKGELLFAGQRKRNRILNGISVNTSTMKPEVRFYDFAESINSALKPNGAWFFQLKERDNGELVLLEVASRLGGSSAVYRAKGVNFASLSIFNAFENPVSILVNEFDVELDRALNNCFKFNIEFNHVYIDLDDTLIVDDKVNVALVSSLYKFLNQRKKIHLITKHKFAVAQTLTKNRISEIFDSIIHLKPDDYKSQFIKHTDAIFIDDSFAERKEVFDKLGIPVFGIDIIL